MIQAGPATKLAEKNSNCSFAMSGTANNALVDSSVKKIRASRVSLCIYVKIFQPALLGSRTVVTVILANRAEIFYVVPNQIFYRVCAGKPGSW